MSAEEAARLPSQQPDDDKVLPFAVEPLDVRGRAVRLGHVLDDALKNHNYPPQVQRALPGNPHVKWQNSRRGYYVCDVTPQAWTTEYRTFEYVSRPGAPVRTPTRWRVEHGTPGIARL